jgi:hypothetical protein
LTSSNAARLRALNGLFGLGAASAQVGEAFLEGNLAEPDIVAGLGEAGFGVGGHLLEPSELGGVDAQEPAAGAPLTELTAVFGQVGSLRWGCADSLPA